MSTPYRIVALCFFSALRVWQSEAFSIALEGRCAPSPPSSLSASSSSSSSDTEDAATSTYKHALAILSMPHTSIDKIANEAVLETVLPRSNKLSVILRCQNDEDDDDIPSTASLRRYVGEIYSQLWDVALGDDGDNPDLPDVVIYPQNLPNAAPESWIDIQPDLDVICSLDGIVGWTSETCRQMSSTRGKKYEEQAGNGRGGLEEHVNNVNNERRQRNLRPVQALPVEGFQSFRNVANNNDVIFVDDDDYDDSCEINYSKQNLQQDQSNGSFFLAGAAPHSHLFYSVCVGGTFDGLHFGHRKLLTLAISSVNPISGRLLVGVTVDEMLQKKQYAHLIPSFEQRCAGVRKFLARLSPGMTNNIFIEPITDAFGPPGKPGRHNDFDALVLSHETLETGALLNQHRKHDLGLPPLSLLCTRRTEAHGMSSTHLRKLRQQQAADQKAMMKNFEQMG